MFATRAGSFICTKFYLWLNLAAFIKRRCMQLYYYDSVYVDSAFYVSVRRYTKQ